MTCVKRFPPSSTIIAGVYKTKLLASVTSLHRGLFQVRLYSREAEVLAVQTVASEVLVDQYGGEYNVIILVENGGIFMF